ncbi:MAG: PQQ-dependent sugar dehydrogenase [Planctomycetota bacterium]
MATRCRPAHRTKSTLLALAVIATFASAPLEALPPGYVAETVASGLSNAVTMAFAPDGRIFYNERTTGRVRVIEGGTLLTPPFSQVSVSTSGELGLLGLAIHPDFTTNGFVYICYSKSSGGHEIGRYTAVGSVGTNYTVIVPSLPAGGIHNGGNIAFGPDGKLYHTMGDNGSSGNSQNASTYPGKIHRFNDDGSIPADNPYTTGLLSRYCMGLRNSFDLCWNETLNLLYASENGTLSNDEANRIGAGLNYGWPTFTCTGAGGFEPALTCWTPTIAPTGITAYTGSNFDPIYLNDLFMADYLNGQIWRLNLSDDGLTYIAREVFHDDSSVYDVLTGPDGLLYYVTSSAIKRIRRLVPVMAPDQLDCTLVGDELTLTWVNHGSGAGESYQNVRILRDGLLFATLPGTTTSYLIADAPGGTHTFEVRGVEGGQESASVSCTVTAALDSIASLTCVENGAVVDLTWTNGDPYESILVERNGVFIIALAPSAQSFTDPAPPFGSVTYELQGVVGAEFAPPAICTVFLGTAFVRGDCNADGNLDIGDSVFLLSALFSAGATPSCSDACDDNDDGAVDLGDPIHRLQALFAGGAPPPAPHPSCGLDPSELDPLDCGTFTACP